MSNTFLYVVTVLIWGSTWLAINYQLGVVSPEVSIVYRYVLASGLLFGWCLLRGLGLRFDLKAHGFFVLFGVFLFGLNYLVAYRAQEYISSALNAVLFSSMVWINILNVRLFFGTRSEPRIYLGAFLGMSGVVVLFLPELASVELNRPTLIGAALSLSGAFIASIGNMTSQKAQSLALPVVQSNAWGMFYAAVLLAIIAVAGGQAFVIDTSAAYLVSLIYLAAFGSVIAFGAYLTLLGRIGSHRAVYVVIMFPVVALVLSILFEGLVIDAYTVVGIALVLTGNALVLVRRS